MAVWLLILQVLFSLILSYAAEDWLRITNAAGNKMPRESCANFPS